MQQLKFEWDKAKSESNIAKHKVSFNEAKTVFDDDNARLIHDPDHSQTEDRFLLLGLSRNLKILNSHHKCNTR